MSTDERDEAWLLAREAGQTGPSPDAERVAQYTRLEALLRALPELEPAPGWEARVAAAAAPPVTPRRRLTWALALAASVVLLVAGLWWWRARQAIEHETPELALLVLQGPVAHRGASAVVGDSLALRFELSGPGELRLYRDDVLVVRCPGDDRCRETAHGASRSIAAEIVADAPGTYRAVLFTGGTVPPHTGAGLAADLEAADKVGLATQTVPAVDVH